MDYMRLEGAHYLMALFAKLTSQSVQRHIHRNLIMQVVAEDRPIVEDVLERRRPAGICGRDARVPELRVITPQRVFQQNARLQLRPSILTDPGEFEFLIFGHSS